MERYVCRLSPELQQIAARELNEPLSGNERLQEIDKLKTTLQEKHPQVTVRRNDDNFYLRFLRAKKFNHDKAVKNLVNYHKIRKEMGNVFEKVDNPVLLDDFLNLGPVMALNECAKDGSVVVSTQTGLCLGENTHYDINDFSAAIILTLETLLDENEEIQISGITLIDNMNNISVKSALQNGNAIGKMLNKIFQDTMPIRIRGIVLINDTLVVDIVTKLIKQLIGEKLRQRIRVKGSNSSKLKEIMNLEYLPCDLGGVGQPADPVMWKSYLFSVVYNKA